MGLNHNIVEAVKKGDLPLVKELLNKGAELNTTISDSIKKRSLLHHASQKGHAEIINYLIEKGILVRDVTLDDSKNIAEIYNHYILNTIVTFANDPISKVEMENRIKDISSSYPWIVYEENGEIQGYAYASRWSSRCAYKKSIETTIYLKNDTIGKGIGTILYQELLYRIKKGKFHAVIGGVSLPNKASIALHEKFGYKKVAHFKEVGYKFDKWIDVAYWELIF